ncbi:MAG: zinc finger domain-containing protein [Solirubrobacteraceae bacterium]
MRLRRETVQKFWCPTCGAAPGQPCVVERTGKIRAQLNAVRVDKAEQMIEAPLRAAGKLEPAG